jgi:hypothetical protein
MVDNIRSEIINRKSYDFLKAKAHVTLLIPAGKE